jgi:hypothetical protein
MVGIQPHQCRNNRMRGALRSSRIAVEHREPESFRLSESAVLA